MQTNSTRSRSSDSKFTDGNLGSANDANELNIKRQINFIENIHERCDKMIDDKGKAIEKLEQ